MLFRTAVFREMPKGCRLGESLEFVRCIVQIHPGGTLLGKKAANTVFSCRLQSRNLHVYIKIGTQISM